jgi:AGCS family alanine or glycine:cation symporter
LIQKRLGEGIRLSLQSKGGYAALATSLAATIGTGNIIGISTAVAIGGAGAVFWCWLTGLAGVATCYAECFLSLRYRRRDENGRWCVGPMYVLRDAMGHPRLAACFALASLFAALGMGSGVQAYSIRLAAERMIQADARVIGFLTACLAGFFLAGGKQKIAKACMCLVPVMSVFYVGGCLAILILHRASVLKAIQTIIVSAFSGRALLGGTVGGGMLLAARVGIARGLFTNEAGLGSIPMSIDVETPEDAKANERQALISMTGPFWDTVVLCAITGITTVVCILDAPNEYLLLAPEQYCFAVFRNLPFGGETILSLSLMLFAFATIIGWYVYGLSAIRYLWKEGGVKWYRIAYLIFVYVGAVMTLDLVWGISDLCNALMAIPNLIALWGLRDRIK